MHNIVNKQYIKTPGYHVHLLLLLALVINPANKELTDHEQNIPRHDTVATKYISAKEQPLHTDIIYDYKYTNTHEATNLHANHNTLHGPVHLDINAVLHIHYAIKKMKPTCKTTNTNPKLILLYICILLLNQSGDINPNPGPSLNTTKYDWILSTRSHLVR